MILKKLAVLFFIVGLAVVFTGCLPHLVAIHNIETPKNHYVIVSSLGTIYDCYSIVDGKWKPVCKVVEERRSSSWSNQSYGGQDNP